MQVTKIRNVSAPKINEESKTAPRMLKISLTDGKTTVHAVEMSKIDGLSLSTAPGTKIKLLKEVRLNETVDKESNYPVYVPGPML